MAFHICMPLSFLFFAIYLLYLYLTWYFDYWKNRGIWGPKPTIIFGNFPSVITGKRHMVYDYDEIYCKYKKSHRVLGVFSTRQPELLILDPKVALEVMVTNFGKFRDNGACLWIYNEHVDKIAARNAFFKRGDDWKPKRSETLSGITINRLHMATPIWRATAQKLSAYMQRKTASNGKVILDSRDLSYRVMLDITFDFLWGIESHAFPQSDENTKSQLFTNILNKMNDHTLRTVGLHYTLNVLPVLKRFFNVRFFPKESDDFFAAITKDAIALRLKDKSMNAERSDFLNYIMQLQEKKNLSDDDVLGHIMTIMLNAYETAGVVLAHCLFYLAHNQRCQQKLRKEILENLAGERFMNYETLHELPYLDQCIHETLRLISPISMYSRVCTEDTLLEIEPERKIKVDVGTVVSIPSFSYHYDEEYFPNPDRYEPERFDGGLHHELTKQGIFIPFGNGPRICLGKRVGLFEIKTALVEILQKYWINRTATTVSQKRPDAQRFVLGLDGDLTLQFERLS